MYVTNLIYREMLTSVLSSFLDTWRNKRTRNIGSCHWSWRIV